MLNAAPADRDSADAFLLGMIERIKAAPPRFTPVGSGRRQAVLAAGHRLLRSEPQGLDRYFVPWTIQNGHWLGAMRGRPPKSLPAVGPHNAGPMINPLGSPFGMRLLIYLVDAKRQMHYASLPITDALVETLWPGRFDVVYHHLQGDVALEVDFGASAESLAAYQAILQYALSVSTDYARDPLLLPMPALAMRRAVADQELLRPRFDAQDWLELGWYEATQRVYGILVNDPYEPKLDLVETISESRYPRAAGLLPYLQLMQERSLPTGTRIGRLLDRLAEVDTLAELMRDIISFDMTAPWLRDSAARNESDTEIATALSYLMVLSCHAMFHPELSANGRRLVSIAGGQRLALDFIELDPKNFPGAEKDPEIARSFWPNFWIEDPPIDLWPTIGTTDLPMRLEDAQAFDWAAFVGDLNAEEAEQAAQHLLEEASALKQWVVPPEAWLDLRLGPFVGADVHELNEDVILVWRLPDGRFFRVIIGASTGRIMHTRPPIADDALARRAGAAIGLLSAAVVRDFWVVEERRRVFEVKRPRAARVDRGSSRPARRRIIYLPRYRYVASGSGLARLAEGLRQVARARHYVRPHFRRAANPSPAQLEQARGLRLEPPPGHTLVRGHYRGGQTQERVYRSRAALALLAGLELEQVSESGDDWFAFERSMAELFRRLGYTVLRRAARGQSDDGIDILATRPHPIGEESWLIQCKAYAPDRPVSVAKVRELLGALSDFAQRHTVQPRGLLVTTSIFSAEATRLAVAHGIQLIDGTSLLAILEAENRRP